MQRVCLHSQIHTVAPLCASMASRENTFLDVPGSAFFMCLCALPSWQCFHKEKDAETPAKREDHFARGGFGNKAGYIRSGGYSGISVWGWIRVNGIWGKGKSGVNVCAPAVREGRCLGGSNLTTKKKRWERLWWESASFHVQPEGKRALGARLISLCYKENSRLGRQQTGTGKTHTRTHRLDLLHPCVLYSTDLHLFPNFWSKFSTLHD